MKPQPELSVIVPVHNEEKRLDRCMIRLFGFLGHQTYESEIILVENGSTDLTAAKARWWADRNDRPPVYDIHIEQAGKGLAVRSGMLAAQGRFCYMADVDLSTPIDTINSFLQASLSGQAIVIGVRDRAAMSPGRQISSLVFRQLVRGLAPYTDTQCGFKMFRWDAARAIFGHLKLEGFAFDVEALYLARMMMYSVLELPVPWHEAPGSQVRLLRDAWRMARDVMKIRGLHKLKLASSLSSW